MARQSGCGAEGVDDPKGRRGGCDDAGRDRLVAQRTWLRCSQQPAGGGLRLFIAGSDCALYPAEESHGDDPGALEQRPLSRGAYLCRVRWFDYTDNRNALGVPSLC